MSNYQYDGLSKMKPINYTLILLLCATFASFSVATSEALASKFYLHLPPSLIQTLEKLTEDGQDPWHPNLMLTKMNKVDMAAKVATKKTFLQKNNIESSDMTLAPPAGSSVVGSSKMNCECRFVKNPDLFGLIQESEKDIANFVQVDTKAKSKVRKEQVEPVYQDDAEFVQDDAKAADEQKIADLEQQLADIAAKMNDDEQKLANMAAPVPAQAQYQEDDDEDLLMLQTKLKNMLQSKRRNDDMFFQQPATPVGDVDFQNFLKLYQNYEAYQNTMMVQTRNPKDYRVQMMAQLLDQNQANDDDAQLYAAFMQMKAKKKMNKEMLLDALLS